MKLKRKISRKVRLRVMKFLSERLAEQTELIKMPQSSSTEEDKTEMVKRKLKKRTVPEDNWQYYVKSPHSWDFSDVNPSELYKGIEVVLLSPITIAPSWVEKRSVKYFIKLKGNLMELMRSKSEIEESVQRKFQTTSNYWSHISKLGRKQTSCRTSCIHDHGR